MKGLLNLLGAPCVCEIILMVFGWETVWGSKEALEGPMEVREGQGKMWETAGGRERMCH